mgnify:CR=1 FL=1
MEHRRLNRADANGIEIALDTPGVDRVITISGLSALDNFADRKALARYAEDKVRSDVAELMILQPEALTRATSPASGKPKWKLTTLGL